MKEERNYEKKQSIQIMPISHSSYLDPARLEYVCSWKLEWIKAMTDKIVASYRVIICNGVFVTEKTRLTLKGKAPIVESLEEG